MGGFSTGRPSGSPQGRCRRRRPAAASYPAHLRPVRPEASHPLARQAGLDATHQRTTPTRCHAGHPTRRHSPALRPPPARDAAGNVRLARRHSGSQGWRRSWPRRHFHLPQRSIVKGTLKTGRGYISCSLRPLGSLEPQHCGACPTQDISWLCTIYPSRWKGRKPCESSLS
jgi:hypothetical protein